MSKKTDSYKIGRDARTGELVTVEKAQSNPDRYVVEHMPKPGHGDTGRGKKR